MSFDEITQIVMDELNLTSPAATIRVGKSINKRYRRLTSSIGLETSRRVVISQAATPGSDQITFTGIEKILAVFEKMSNPAQDTVLQQITVDEMHITPRRAEPPRHFAVANIHSNSVHISMDCTAGTAFLLYADGQTNVSTLSGAQVPDFPESFHDTLVFGAMADEYRKMEKLPLMQEAESNYEKRLSDLRMWIAKSAYLQIYQGRYNGKSFRWTRDAQLVWDL